MSTMSQAERDEVMKAEIQKLLTQINRDMGILKTEMASLGDIVGKDAPLPVNIKLVNERLMVSAKEAGIDLDDLEIESSEEEIPEENESESGNNVGQQSGSEEEEEEEEGEQNEPERDNTQQSSQENEPTGSMSNAASVAAASKKLTKKVKRTLR